MAGFFEAFWPNLVATLLGVALGVPMALYINRSVLKHQRVLDAAESDRRLCDAIEVLIDACQYNIRVLKEIRELALSGRVMHSPDLRLTTWEAVGPIFSGGCSDPVLLQMLSHHWLRLNRVYKL